MSGYKPYPKYKDSGFDWLGKIPDSWGFSKLKYSFKIVGGSTPRSDDQSLWDGGVVWVSPTDLSKRVTPYISTSERTISLEGLSSCGACLVPPRSLILSTRAPIGSIGISDTELCTNQGCKSLVPSVNVSTEYYFYILQSCTKELNIRGKGTTFLELSADALGAIIIPSPSFNEQSAISKFLDRETSRIDTLIHEQRELIELLKEKRQAVISNAVTKGLNPKVKMKDSGVEWIGEIPAHWDIYSSRRLFTERKDRAFPDDIQLTASQKYGIVTQKVFTELEDQKVVQVILGADILKHVEPNDFVISMRSFQGGLEYSAIKGCISSAYVMLIPDSRIYPHFYKYLFKSNAYIQALQSTSNLVRDGQALRFNNFAMVSIPLPPYDEQKTIASHIDRELKKIDALSNEAESVIELMQEHRASLISEAVTGKIDVRGINVK